MRKEWTPVLWNDVLYVSLLVTHEPKSEKRNKVIVIVLCTQYFGRYCSSNFFFFSRIPTVHERVDIYNQNKIK